jgi:tRNA(Ile)-lysidine synthase TilS/MesJ
MSSTYREIRDSLCQLYLEDERPWLVGFSGGKDSTMLASPAQAPIRTGEFSN